MCWSERLDCCSHAHIYKILVCTGTCCSSTLEAAEILSARPDKFDIILAEVRKANTVKGDCSIADMQMLAGQLFAIAGQDRCSGEPCICGRREWHATSTHVRGGQCKCSLEKH